MLSARKPTHRGAMTAAMSALNVHALSTVLRVAIVRGGRILQEQIFPANASVTVGTGERCDLLLDANAPLRHTLFVATPSGHELRVPGGQRAQVSIEGQLREVTGSLTLGRDSRGKILFGDTVLLFQITVAPPLAPRPQLPEGVKTGLLRHLDWRLTIIAAFSFLAHFGAIGSLYTDWNDQIVADQESVVSLLPKLTSVPPTPIDPDPQPDVTDPNPAPNPTPNPTNNRNPTNNSTARTNNSHGPSPIEAAAIGAALARIETETLGVVGASGPSIRNVLEGNTIPGNLDLMAQTDRPIDGSPGALRLQGASGPVGPNGRPTLADGIPGGRAATPATTVPSTAPPAPTTTTTDKPTPPGGRAPDDAQRVIALARARARACFDRGLTGNPDMEGNVSFVLSVSGGGSVLNASVSPSGNLNGEVVSCIQRALKDLSFNGGGQSSTVSGSFRLINSNKKKP